MGAQRALGLRRYRDGEVDESLVALVERVTRRLRKARRIGRTVVVRLRFGDYTRATRSHTLPRATAETAIVLATARFLLDGALRTIERDGLTMVGVTVADLQDDAVLQLGLPFAPGGRHALDAALDEVRERFGSRAVVRAVLVGREEGPTVPLLPD
jgi:DNA polymerase-4